MLHEVLQLVVDVGESLVEHSDVVVGLVAVELDDALHLDFHEAQDVVARDFAVELRLEWLESLVDVLNSGVLVLGLLVATILVDALLDEDFLERSKEERLHGLQSLNLEFALENILGVVNAELEQVGCREELWLLVLDDANIGRNACFAVAESVECVDGLVARCSWLQSNDDFGS